MKSKHKNQYLIALGSNLGDRQYYIESARALIAKVIGPVISWAQSIETSPLGPADQLFLNSALICATDANSEVVMCTLLEIENILGRTRTQKWGNRTIDLDLIFCKLPDGTIQTCQSDLLTLPHPQMHLRDFVLLPAAEIAGDWHHPVFDKSIRELLEMTIVERCPGVP